MKSNSLDTEVLIIGGGPVGCYLGSILSPEKDVLIVERGEIGLPVNCAGIVGNKVFEEFPLSEESIINKVNGAIFNYNPFNEDIDFRISRDQVQAQIIDREVFDKKIAGKARENGVRILENHEYLREEDDLSIIRSVEDGSITEIDYNYLVGADGVFSEVAKIFDFELDGEILVGPQIEVPFSAENNFVRVIVDKSITNFFVWVIPTSNNTARVGTLDGDLKDLKELCSHYDFLEDEIINIGGGAVPVGSRGLFKDNVFLVGDAAAQVKPLTAGGIYYGMKAADILGKSIINEDPSRYVEKWGEFQKELNKSNRYRKLYKKMGDRSLKFIFYGLSEPEVIKIIEEEADFERHSEIVRKILPKILYKGLINTVT